LIFFVLLIVPSCTKAPKTGPDTSKLVWPRPPDKPRIKYLGSVSSEEDVSGKRKRKLEDVILGRDPGKKIRRLRQPYGICVDSKGKIYVSDSGQAVVFVFDQETNQVSFIGTKGRGKLVWPTGIAVDKDFNLYVSDSRLKTVLKYNAAGEYQFALGKKGDFTNPTGLAIDQKRNRLLVVDTRAHHIKVFALKDGQFITQFGERGWQEGLFNFPTNIAVGKDGYVYIVDTGNHRVQVFDKHYDYYDDFGTLGTHPGQFRRPKGITLDSDNNIYVIDSDFNNFQIFNQEYQILMPVGRYGRSPGQFWLPAGIFVDSRDRVFVVDTMNKRVQIFQYISQK